jgi:hypothetical protein
MLERKNMWQKGAYLSFSHAFFSHTRGSSSAQELSDIVVLQETSEENRPVLLNRDMRGFKNSVDFASLRFNKKCEKTKN